MTEKEWNVWANPQRSRREAEGSYEEPEPAMMRE
jgi:hypothetical protein